MPRCVVSGRFPSRRLRRAVLALSGLLLLPAPLLAADDRTGEQIWQAQCAKCHGVRGEGVEGEYAEPLIGDKPIGELARIIEETMPADDPGTCIGPAAAKVAAYLYDAFYSPIAQARNRPARVAFSRLTVPQYRNAVADLIASFRGAPPERGEPSGLSARYSQDREGAEKKGGDQDVKDENPDDEIVFERIDGRIDFDFGEGSPNPETFSPAEFRINWSGAVYAPETGDYEFIVETQNGMRLWVNDMDEPLIDGRVRSGTDVVWRETITLLGGRCYGMRIEFFKSARAMEKTARIRLKWKTPQGPEEVIPAHHLYPQQTPKVLIVGAPFPPDDRSEGYERGTTVSKEWDGATTYAAIEAAEKIAADLDELVGRERRDGGRGRRGRGRGEEAPPAEQPSGPDERVIQLCRQFVERAFRRPLTDEERSFFVDRHFAEAPNEEDAVKRVVLLALKSPRFLFRETAADAGEFDDYDTASWLAFGLWDSLPDQPLLDAAARGELRTREQIAAQVERMMSDPRSRHKLREFLHQWLNLDRIRDVTKDAQLYPEFNEQVLADLRVSLDLSLDDVVWSESSDYRQLLISDAIYLNGRLAKFYGADLPEDSGFVKVALNPEWRAGVLTHPYLMTGFAYTATSSPIHRGVFLSRNILGRFLKPPQDAVTPVPPELHPDLSTRERVALQTSPDACKVCHQMINGLGFSLEHFDAVGRFRSEERGKPIDARGEYLATTGETVEFNGARELAAYVADSPEAQTAFVEQLFRFLTKQPVQAFGTDRLDVLQRQFAADGFHIRRLAVNVLTDSALSLRDARPEAG